LLLQRSDLENSRVTEIDPDRICSDPVALFFFTAIDQICNAAWLAWIDNPINPYPFFFWLPAQTPRAT
jgi:hypothetical protein